MRHDIPDVGKMSEQYPHLIFHNFTSKLGERVLFLIAYNLQKSQNFSNSDQKYFEIFVPGSQRRQ